MWYYNKYFLFTVTSLLCVILMFIFRLQLITINVSFEGVCVFLMMKWCTREASFLKEFIYKSSVRAERPHHRCRRGPSSWWPGHGAESDPRRRPPHLSTQNTWWCHRRGSCDRASVRAYLESVRWRDADWRWPSNHRRRPPPADCCEWALQLSITHTIMMIYTTNTILLEWWTKTITVTRLSHVKHWLCTKLHWKCKITISIYKKISGSLSLN